MPKLEAIQKALGKSIFGQNGRGDATAPGTIEQATLERPRPRGHFPDGLKLARYVVAVLVVATGLQTKCAMAGRLQQLQEQAVHDALVGTWVGVLGAATVTLELDGDDNFTLDDDAGRYSIEPGMLLLYPDTSEDVKYDFELQGEMLVLSGGDLSTPLRFARPAPSMPPSAAVETLPVAPPPIPPKPIGIVGAEQAQVLARSLPGHWSCDAGKGKLNLRLGDDGHFTFGAVSGMYKLVGNVLTLQSRSATIAYQVDLSPQDMLTLSGGDLTQPLKFAHGVDAGSALRRSFHFSPITVKQKAIRLGTIVLIVVFARLMVYLLKRLSRFVIFSEWGPLLYLYRQHQSRVLTVHSLVLNLCKYIVYFSALGAVLTEMGVNYAAYLASLSVIGLAVGFGSQGLVQDVVTGFFIIFENQFEIDDLVDISGQTGIVEELGLRMTRLRNYFGQEVIIPNRNIAMVANYARTGLQAYVDIAIAGKDAAQKAVPLLEVFASELARQFPGVIRAKPCVIPPLSLATGEQFVRIRLDLWPQQQWLVDQQFIPRIREVLKRGEIEVPGDRVIAYYHVRKPLPTRAPAKSQQSPSKD